MSVIEEISKTSNSDCDDDVLMTTFECELNRDKYEDPEITIMSFVRTVTWKR